METTKLFVSPSPHILSKNNSRNIMLLVIIALLPTLVAASLIFGLRVLLLTGVTVAACVGFEALWCVLLKKPVSAVGDLSAIVTGLILAYNLPPSFPLWMATIGALVSIVVTKQLFGGIGMNFANPAIVGRIVLQVSFTGKMIDFSFPSTLSGVDALASATPLKLMQEGTVPLIDLLVGTHGGMLGETCSITLILGGLFLLFTKVISPVIPLVYIGGVFVLKSLLGIFVDQSSFQVISLEAIGYVMTGGLLLGAFFMATDYTTSPFTRKGKWVYGIGLAIITVALREWSNMAEGVSYAILLMNLLVPYINETCRQRPMGVDPKRDKARRKAAATGKGEA